MAKPTLKILQQDFDECLTILQTLRVTGLTISQGSIYIPAEEAR